MKQTKEHYLKAYKWPAHRIFILAFIVTFGCAPLYSIAEDEISLVSGENSPTIAEKMDAIGFEYSEDENGDVEASLVIDGEKTVFAILPWKDKGSLQIASLYSKNDIHSLRCIVSPECQGAELKSAIYSFVHAMIEFRSSEIKYSKEFSSGENTVAQQKQVITSNIADETVKPESNILPGNVDTPLVLDGKWYIEFGNAEQVITAYKNTSGKPIIAFRITWGLLDDFGEVAIKLKTEYIGSSTYFGNGTKSQGHVIQPGETIYYSTMLIDGVEEIGFFADREGLQKELSIPKENMNNYIIDKKYIFNIDKIIYADK